MPFKSKAQARFFFAAKNKKGGLDNLSQKDASKFIKDTNHQKLEDLPEKVPNTRFKSLKKVLRSMK